MYYHMIQKFVKIINFVLCILVIVTEIKATEVQGKLLHKREADERWIWGYAEILTTRKAIPTPNPTTPYPYNDYELNLEQSRVSPEEKNISDPCVPYDAPMPDFTAPGRRIAISKCYEYIWETKNQMEKAKRDKECYDKSFHIFVVGGRTAYHAEFPHMGAIGWKAAIGTWVFKCGSTLISPKFVLTAAHCSRTSSIDTTVADTVPKIVRLGSNVILDSIPTDYGDPILPTDENIIKILVHPSYKSPNKYYDIALMELENAVTFSEDLHPACVWTNTDEKSVHQQATVTGWGVVESGSRDNSPDLQVAVLDIIDSETCDNNLRPSYCNRHWCGLHDDQLCAANMSGGVDSCQGDSGGPLQVRIHLPPQTFGAMHYVIGVTSFGIGCGIKNMPGVYTKVASFVDWIESIVWP